MYLGDKLILTENFNEITYLVSQRCLTMVENRCFSTFHVN